MRVPHHSYSWLCHNNNQRTWKWISQDAAGKATGWYQRGVEREDTLFKTGWDILTSLGQPAWRWREQERWRSQRKSQQPSPCSCWGWVVLQSAARDATKGEAFRGAVLMIKTWNNVYVWPSTPCKVTTAAHLLWESLQLLFGVNILPNSLHVIPVVHNPMLHRVPNRQQASVFLITRGCELEMAKFRYLSIKLKWLPDDVTC